MTTFDKREQGFETQFAHEEEVRFKASARRNRLVGLWAAEKLGLAGSDAEAYAKAIVMVDDRRALICGRSIIVYYSVLGGLREEERIHSAASHNLPSSTLRCG